MSDRQVGLQGVRELQNCTLVCASCAMNHSVGRCVRGWLYRDIETWVVHASQDMFSCYRILLIGFVHAFHEYLGHKEYDPL
jgi:hypothetical protein